MAQVRRVQGITRIVLEADQRDRRAEMARSSIQKSQKALIQRKIEAKAKQVQQRRVEKSMPPEFVCPISTFLMTDPVMTADGHTYERESIQRWLAGSNTSPKTNLQLPHKNLVPNFALRTLIQTWGQITKQVVEAAPKPPRPPIASVDCQTDAPDLMSTECQTGIQAQASIECQTEESQPVPTQPARLTFNSISTSSESGSDGEESDSSTGPAPCPRPPVQERGDNPRSARLAFESNAFRRRNIVAVARALKTLPADRNAEAISYVEDIALSAR